MVANTGVTAVIAGGLIGLGAHRRGVKLGEQSVHEHRTHEEGSGVFERVDVGAIGTGSSIYDSTWAR
jgi:hypothetical protein